MSFEQSKSKIVELFTELGLKRNPINKLMKDDFHSKYYSFNSITSNIGLSNHIGSYIFDIDIAIYVKNNDDVDQAQTFFDLIVHRISELDSFLSFYRSPTLKQVDRNPNKLILNLSFIMDNYYC